MNIHCIGGLRSCAKETRALKVGSIVTAHQKLTLATTWNTASHPSGHGILQARILEWAPFPPPGDLPDPGMEPGSSALQADSLPFEPPGKLHKDIFNL